VTSSSIRDLIRKAIPRAVLSSVRFAYVYHRLRGHSRRDKDGFCIDAQRNPIPWITYPALDYLTTMHFSGASVFEFGAGSSTAWWSKRARTVTSVEMDRDWYERVRRLNLPNVKVILCQDGGSYPRTIAAHGQDFDVVAIDGAERYRSAVHGVEKLASRGLMLLDNAEWYPNTAAFLTSKGFTEVDFFGFSPINSFPSVTSLFFRGDCRFFHCREKMNLDVIGGADIIGGALDDKP
jgi:protein-L-isoaspartate O-methyltransferase